eukprot:TRINITY_DN3_c0_g1_i12.p1 TRINITY_DN3_c0_g1~~TRINITY_DN3_c0_g1_i12.p1  ORF type:complete len:146 (-),score=26.69 TRINITY_DN3_c0_g1_i12:61-444(-)
MTVLQAEAKKHSRSSERNGTNGWLASKRKSSSRSYDEISKSITSSIKAQPNPSDVEKLQAGIQAQAQKAIAGLQAGAQKGMAGWFASSSSERNDCFTSRSKKAQFYKQELRKEWHKWLACKQKEKQL